MRRVVVQSSPPAVVAPAHRFRPAAVEGRVDIVSLKCLQIITALRELGDGFHMCDTRLRQFVLGRRMLADNEWQLIDGALQRPFVLLQLIKLHSLDLLERTEHPALFVQKQLFAGY